MKILSVVTIYIRANNVEDIYNGYEAVKKCVCIYIEIYFVYVRTKKRLGNIYVRLVVLINENQPWKA